MVKNIVPIVKIVLGVASFFLALYLALQPNPLRDALIDLIKALAELIKRL